MSNSSLLTASRINCVLSCQRKHFWRYEVGLKPAQAAEALRLGSAWHRAMEARWTGQSYEQSLAAALPPGDLDELQAATIAGLLAGYYQRYGEKDDLVTQIHPEVEFRTKLDGSRSFEAAGKIDGLVVLRDGRTGILEHKTTSESVEPDSDYWLRLRFDPQILQYVDAARLLGWPIETVIYDVARKPSIRPKQVAKLGRLESPEEYSGRLVADIKERPDFYFSRREVPVLDQDLEEFRIQRLVISRQILQCRGVERKLIRREQAWPRALNARVCGFCEYANPCLQNITIDYNNPPTGFVVGQPNEELSQPSTL